MRNNFGLDFEYCVRQFLGDRASHIADVANNDVEFRKYLRECIKEIRKRIDKVDTTVRHKERLMSEVNNINDQLKTKGIIKDKEIIIKLFWFISRLLGYDFVSGSSFNEPIYHQTFKQYEKEKMNQVKKGDDYWKERTKRDKNIISERLNVCKILKDKGLNDSEISQVLHITEYEFKKIKHNI